LRCLPSSLAYNSAVGSANEYSESAVLGKPGKTTDPQIIPITKDEFAKILKACEFYPDKKTAKRFKAFALRLKALVLVMRYTGLRIRDAHVTGCTVAIFVAVHSGNERVRGHKH